MQPIHSTQSCAMTKAYFSSSSIKYLCETDVSFFYVCAYKSRSSYGTKQLHVCDFILFGFVANMLLLTPALDIIIRAITVLVYVLEAKKWRLERSHDKKMCQPIYTAIFENYISESYHNSNF